MTIDNLNITNEPTSVLILEDNPQTLVWLSEIVNETFPSATVNVAKTLKDATKLVKDHSFDLALVDLGLPDGSGIDLITSIRQDSNNTYVVVATIFEDDAHLLSALRAGANGYLLKTESREILISHLRGIAASRAPLSNKALDQVMDHFSQQAPPAELIALTTREEEVLQLVAKGFNVTESANLLGLSANTVKSYLKAVYSKLGISSRAEAATEAIKRQLIKV